MKITSCIPLPGTGLVARHGGLVALTDGAGTAPDPLLAVLSEVAGAAGDGSELVLRAAKAALACPGQPAWACAGITADSRVAVLVHGHAVAVVRAADASDVTLTAGDSLTPLSRVFAAPAVTVGLTIGNPPAPDSLFWLGDGVVPGGGLAVTVSAGMADPAMMTPDAAPAVRAPAAPQPGRPPFGVLELDDGTRITLDGDYVLGREPALDGDVIAGRARPVRVTDPDGTVSRLHLRVSLVGGRVEITDLGSANGSSLETPGGRRALVPFEPAVIEPGARIALGHRSMQYVAYQGAPR